MAEVLLLGVSHYPMLAIEDARMAGILQRMLANPDLPAELRSAEGWPAAMQAEWGADRGLAAAAVHRRALIAGMTKVRATLDAFNPDLVLIWGDDQYENFREDIIPAFCIAAHDEFNFVAPAGNVWGEAADREWSLPGARQAGKALATALLEAGFDAAYAYRPLHDRLGHAFANALLFLDYSRDNPFRYPILPVSINCYGRRVIAQKGGVPTFDRPLLDEDLDPPAPNPARLFDLGAATARHFAESPLRVALLASSSWSHAFLTEKNHYLFPDITADRRLYEALRNGDYAAWRATTTAQIEASGQQEVLNWFCLAGALDALGRVADYTEFVETWMFNSSKVFLTAARR